MIHIFISIVLLIFILCDYKFHYIEKGIENSFLESVLIESDIQHMIDDLQLKQSMKTFTMQRIYFTFLMSSFIFLFYQINSLEKAMIGLIVFVVLYKYKYYHLKQRYKVSILKAEQEISKWLKQLLILLHSQTVAWSLLLSYPYAPDIIKTSLLELLNKMKQGDDNLNSFLEFAYHFKDVHKLPSIMRMLSRVNGKSNKEKSLQVLSVAKEINHLQQKIRNDRFEKEIKTMNLYGYISLLSLGMLIFVFLIAQVMFLNITT